MPTPIVSTLSQTCRKIADFLLEEMNRDPGDPAHTIDNVDAVTLGNPEAAKSDGDGSKQKVNLFFYHFSPFEFNADVLPGETAMWRAYCLITPFAVDEGLKTAGELDLRLLGEVIRVFHENPVNVWTLKDSQDNDFSVHVQAVFKHTGIEELNQIWSTQGNEVAYRPSVAYEFALAPVIPRVPAEQAKLVAATGFSVEGSMEHAGDVMAGEDYSAIIRTPEVAVVRVNGQKNDWVPAACLLHDSAYVQSLIFSDTDPFITASGSQLGVRVAGMVGESVSLRWEIWDSQAGWLEPADASVATLVVSHDSIDPSQIATADVSVNLPIIVPGQAVLYVEHSYQRASDEVELTVRSNPMMLTIYKASP